MGERERRADLGDGGGAFCAYVDGECVVDLWTGGRPGWAGVGEDTRAVVMSSTKGLTTLCAHLLEDRGELDLDAPVVRYWPEFGSEGQVVDHGAPAAQPPVGRHRAPRVRRAAVVGRPGVGATPWPSPPGSPSGAPAWEPGTRHGYHGVTFGWLVGELVRRISGPSLGTFFEAEVAGPLGVAGSISIGTPAAELGSVATVMEFPVRPGKESALRAIDPESKSGRSVLAGAHGSLFADEEGRPRFAEFMNTPAVLQAEIGALGRDGDGAGPGPCLRRPGHR